MESERRVIKMSSDLKIQSRKLTLYSADFASEREMTRVLYVAYPLLQVHDESAGGAEQILWTLEREIARGGAKTIVAASAGSRVSGELFSTGEPCTQPDDYERRRNEHEDGVVEFVRQRAREGNAFNLIHDHSGSFWKRAAEVDTDVLATLHLPRSFYPAENFNDVPPNVSFNCVSDSQARSFADLESLADVVPNGIALDCFKSVADTAADRVARDCSGWDVSVKKKLRTWPLILPSALRYQSRWPDKFIHFLITSSISSEKSRPGFEPSLMQDLFPHREQR